MTEFNQSTDRTVVDTILQRQAELNVTDEQLATAFGLNKASSIKLFKQGTLKMPIQRVPMVASVLSLDPASLLHLLLSEYLPDVLATIDALATPMSLSEDEHDLLSTYRDLCGQSRGRLAVVNGKAVVALIVE